MQTADSVQRWQADYGKALSFHQPPRRAGRRFQRLPTKEKAILLVHSETGQREYEGVTINSSPQGARIQTSYFSLAPGQIVEVSLTEGLRRAARCRAVWAGSPGSERYGQAGIEFLGPF